MTFMEGLFVGIAIGILLQRIVDYGIERWTH